MIRGIVGAVLIGSGLFAIFIEHLTGLGGWGTLTYGAIGVAFGIGLFVSYLSYIWAIGVTAALALLFVTANAFSLGALSQVV